MNLANPADIRHRGDRLRRRRTALTVAGAALAVALVATPIAVIASGGGDDVQPAPPSPTITDPPSEEPSETSSAGPAVVAQIPEDFPLDAGYPPRNDDGTPVEITETPAVGSIEPCGRTAWAPPDDALDVAGASYAGPEDGRSRTLVLYPDAEAASAALEGIRGGVADCPTEDGAGPVDSSAWAEVDSPWEEDSAVVTRRYLTAGRPNTGLEVYQAVRVANVLVVDVNYGEGGATDESVTAFADAVAEQLADVVTAMGMFDPTPTGPGPAQPDAPALPAYFLPSARDLPTRERLTPWERVETTDDGLVGCQPDVGLGAEEVIQRSFAARIAPSDGLPAGEDVAAEVRVSVLQYGSTADAEAAEAAVTGWIRDCADPADPGLADATRQGGLVETDQAGRYGTWVYAAPESCTDCDAAWFERMGVLADQGRMVVVSLREIGGPLEPEGLDATMRDLMLLAAGRSMPG